MQKLQPTLFPVSNDSGTANELVAKRTGSFVDNMKLPLHRWFRYSAGFSGEWVESELEGRTEASGGAVLDPFAGSGTTLLAAERLGIPAIGAEAHPFVHRIASAKLAWSADADHFLSAINEVVKQASSSWEVVDVQSCPSLLSRIYSGEALMKLEALRLEYDALTDVEPRVGQLIWLAITSILRESSTAGTAPWQYVLPNKQKMRVSDPLVALSYKAQIMAADMRYAQQSGYKESATIHLDDARTLASVADNSVSTVITSPPYPNNYDYADATRLEQTFWREVESWGDLHGEVRQHLIVSCSQHASKEKLELEPLLQSPVIAPIRDGLQAACEELAEVRLKRGGRKAYHTMVAAYFVHLGEVMHQLRRVSVDGVEMCFVVGDSAPYGVHVPVERWLGELAIGAGFKDFTFEKLRDRNTKWKNRKHRVPLHEGNLRIGG